MGRQWYAARTKPRAESLAATELSGDGFEIFSPWVKAPHARAGYIEAPLFPGYLFLRCDPESEGWPTFRPAHRILGWVNFEGKVPSLPDEVISELMARSEGINQQGGLWKRFQVGERVRVVSHSIDGLAEILEEAKSPQSRAKVLIEFMGRLVQAQVPWENLEAVQDKPDGSGRAPRRTRGKNRWIRGFGPAVSA